MKAFIISLEHLFKMNSGLGEDQNFSQSKQKLLIPLYQREYKWTDDRINSLLHDIKSNDKFLGNIILDEVTNCYEIVDGQQRLTTCILILAALYSKYAGHPLEQSTIMELLKPFGNFLLQNDSVNDYIAEENDVITICIDDEKDIYGQKEDFIRAYKIIQDFINKLTDNNSLSDFKQKLLSCNFLILINDNHSPTRSVEQLFLDINEKAQLLLVEDIFKGHCFEKYSATQRPHLKENWVKIKKASADFRAFGFEDTSKYIYLYLLENDNNTLTASLSNSGKHYLDNMSMDEIDALLCDMINFGQSNITFYKNLKRNDYRFIDLCSDAEPHKNTSDHITLKQMSLSILNNTKSTYQKLPFLYFIHHINKTENGSILLKYDNFRKIITNLFIYSILFSLSIDKKSKKAIDHSLRDKLKEATSVSSSEVVKATRELRKSRIENIEINPAFILDTMQFIYSIVDNYVSTAEWTKMLYDYEINKITKEHLIIPDNRNAIIKWEKGDAQISIQITPEIVKQNKKSTANFILIHETLNGIIESYDIVYKIKAIKEWYKINSPIPKHVSIFLKFIEDMPEYKKLKKLKNQSPSIDVLTATYNEFVSKYFSREKEILDIITQAFKSAFRNDL